MRGLRLVHQLFLAYGVVAVVVAGLVAWHVAVTAHLTAENRAVVHEAIPVVRLEIRLLEAVSVLRRLEARHAVLRDATYRRLFEARAEAVEAGLRELGDLVATRTERESVADLRTDLAAYRALAAARPSARGEIEAAADGLEALLTRLYAQSHATLGRRMTAATALEARTRLIGWGAGGAIVLVGLATSALAAVRVARPLRRLQEATREVARREFAEPLAARGPDEVAALTRAFNAMAARLRDLDRMKEEFFASISHDFRSPLAAIGWSAELLQGGAAGPLTPKQVRLVQGIQQSSRRLLGLVNQILDLGRLRAGRLTLDRQPTSLAALVGACADEVRPLADRAGLRLDVAVPDDLPKVDVDPERIQQVFANLLGNAVKFTPAGGVVTVSGAATAPEVLVRVRDTGIGIPAPLLPRIFDRYEQAHPGRGGTGLGLAVVKELVEAHGGRVAVESEEGRGTCFTVALPRPGGAP
jgi:two-component system sensor histidine kinase GlrK